MDAPDFINTTQADVFNMLMQRYTARYLEQTGDTRILYPGQAEYLQLESIAYVIFLKGPLKIQSAAEANLVQFAEGPVLDLHAEPFGVIRLPEQFAQCTAQLTLNAGHGDLVIPAGIRFQSQDGQATFLLTSNTPVASAVNTVIVTLTCDQPGTAGNGYAAGLISAILDPQAYLVSAVNTDTTAGGSDVESDESERERLYLSPAAFSVAGAEDAYIYWAKTASPLITDVKLDTDEMAGILLYVLVPGGVTAPQILADVEAACSPKNRRPTSDQVTAVSPEVVNYALDIDVWLYSSYADPQGLVARGLADVQTLANSNGQKLGIDVILSQVSTAASVPAVSNGVAKVRVNSPGADIVLAKNQVGVCTGVTYNLVGFNDDK